ncbi:FtsW/RodA/SpoVE family cell cycle protein [Pseudoflavonifractor sp. An184]|uniref:FtsW/RodA/SpoVE family cell cycle protein n=1 Tax=Pseudoflavonifractor sp. An184 TaxID=1965576 RepID=UPI000B3814EE|nr:FtsW/RodA/SpoVE family cell cycle protein [Pseudoflavonifractor sp. An184]OUP57718.1 cell division protein FtsW [Pseudoflavonifractor sp. An184]
MNTLFSPLQEFWKKGDKLLLLLCLLASAYGVALIYSATRYNENDREVIIQIIAILLGVVVYILCTFVDFQLFVEKNWKWLFVGSVLFILLLLTPFGSNVGGNRNWLDLPFLPINIQPNEIDKIPFILLLALLITKIQDQGRDIGSVLSVLQIGAYTVFMLGLIAAVCGDMGMCVVYTFIFVTMAWSAGVKLRWFVLAIGAVVIGFAVLWIFVLPNTAAWDSVYFIKRIRVLFDHSFEPLGVGLQQTRSLLAIGSGQIFGKGYLQGSMTQSTTGALPARDTDFIFAVCGEELGMVGCLALLLLLSLIILRCIWVARNANSPFHAYVAMGMAGMLLIQVAANVGMCLFVFPVMGLTLPFFSYGGSSIITLYAAMGIVSSIKARNLPSWLRDRSGQ